MDEQPKPTASRLSARTFWILFLLISVVGTAIRVSDSASWRRTGFDELIYRRYVNMMDGGKQVVPVFRKGQPMSVWTKDVERTGAAAMPDLTDFFLETQESKETECELPPTRFLYIYTSWLWKCVQFGNEPPMPVGQLNAVSGDDRSQDADHRDPALASLHRVACLFVTLLMIAGGLFASRVFGRGAGLGVLALMAFDPMQIHFSQHALIDGFFTFWAVMALWTTWECLRAPNDKRWLIAHGAILALMVLTKENAFFVYCALAAVVIANRWAKWGTVSPRFLAVSVIAPGVGVLLLMMLAGGASSFIAVYSTLVAKAQNLDYARLTGDGPWYRYFIDLMIISPIVLILAIGALFKIVPVRKELMYFTVFVAASYLIMCNVKYGMNLRYASIWELPLRAAAVLMVWELCKRFGQRRELVATLMIAGICALEFRQYLILGTDSRSSIIRQEKSDENVVPLYELVTEQLLQRVNVIKKD